MKKILIFAILLLLIPFTANAHSGLSTSTPAEGESLTEAPREILFQFDSPIQQGDMNMSDSSGTAVEFSDISASETELRGEFGEALPNGTYTVEWSVISEDSHEVTGALTFNVAAEAVEEEAAEEAVATETVEEENTSEAVEGEADEAAAPADDQAQAGIPWVTILIIALLLIAAATFFIVARKK